MPKSLETQIMELTEKWLGFKLFHDELITLSGDLDSFFASVRDIQDRKEKLKSQ